VDVEEPEPRNLEQRGRQNFSVRDDDAGVRLQRGDRVEHFPNFERLRNRQAELASASDHRRHMHFHPAPGGTIGLRDDERDFVLALHRPQRRNRKLGRTEEDDAHGRGFYVVVVTGGLSGIVVVVGCAGGLTGLYGATVPSTPLDGCGGGWTPCAGGDCFAFCGGCVMAGGAF